MILMPYPPASRYPVPDRYNTVYVSGRLLDVNWGPLERRLRPPLLAMCRALRQPTRERSVLPRRVRHKLRWVVWAIRQHISNGWRD